MDAAGLTVLLRELAADTAVARDAAQKAEARLREQTPGHLEAAAYELTRLYNVIERMLERVCDAFENHFEKRGDYHERLLQRLALDLEGIRPALIPPDRLGDLRELKGFRHLVRHAYDLTLRPDRLAELVVIARQVTTELPQWCTEFEGKVCLQQGWQA
jgi:Rad3-related DNA helicase